MSALFDRDKVKLSPKDFVLNGAMMIALYVSTFSFLALIFSYIDFLYPDVLAYHDPYSTGMRAAIATLLVVFPLFIFLTRYINEDIRAHEEKEELGFRKWLIYITLLIAGGALAVDLIMLVNSFLSGDIVTSFVLKVFSVFIILSAIFAYYLLSLKGYWKDNASLSIIYGSVISVVVFGTIVSGFFIMGSPADQRLYRFDEQKVSDLQNIQWQIITYWQNTNKLPDSLASVNDPIYGFVAPRDPQTGEAYDYIVSGPLTFSLCANFNKEDRAAGSLSAESIAYPVKDPMSETWSHSEGYTCFERVIDKDRYEIKR